MVHGKGQEGKASKTVAAVVAVGLSVAAGILGWNYTQTGPQASTKPATILFMNDIYRIAGIKRGTEGGIARIASIRKELQAKGHDLLLLHAGDALSPSLLGDMYDGAQMVDALNLLDGSGSFDDRFFLTFGNHEFDDSSCLKPNALVAQVTGSHFTWLAGNMDFSQCPNTDSANFSPLASAGNVVPLKLVTVGGIRIGLFGLTLDESTYSSLLTDRHGTGAEANTDSYVAAAKRLSADLRAQGAEYVIGLTHLSKDDDRTLLERLGDKGPDLIIGGHDHAEMKIGPVNGRYIYKQTADARDIGAVTFRRAEDGTIKASARKIYTLKGDTPAKDPLVQARVDDWLAKHETAFCAKKGLEEGCLDDPMGTTQVDWKLEEYSNREMETAIGNWLADQMQGHGTPTFEQCDATSPVVGLLPAGGLRLNYDLPKGFELQRREVEELFPFSQKLVTLCVRGDDVRKALVNGLSHPGEGRWPHLSGLKVQYSYDSATDDEATIKEITVNGRVLANTDRVRLITNSYTASRGDSYDWPVCLEDSGIDWSVGGARSACEARIMADKESTTAKPIKTKGGEVFNMKTWILDEFYKDGDKGVGPATELSPETKRQINEKG